MYKFSKHCQKSGHYHWFDLNSVYHQAHILAITMRFITPYESIWIPTSFEVSSEDLRWLSGMTLQICVFYWITLKSYILKRLKCHGLSLTWTLPVTDANRNLPPSYICSGDVPSLTRTGNLFLIFFQRSLPGTYNLQPLQQYLGCFLRTQSLTKPIVTF